MTETVLTQHEAETQAGTIAEALQGKRVGKGWMAFCPVHEADVENHATPSLSINVEGNKPLFHCLSADCSQSDILSALADRGLWKRKSRKELDEHDYGEVESYEYCDPDGRFLTRKTRLEAPCWDDEKKRFEIAKKFYFNPEIRANYLPISFYRAERLAKFPKMPVWLVEGERCVHAVESINLFGLSLHNGSNARWNDDLVALLNGRRVILIPDEDSGGEHWLNNAIAALYGKAQSVRSLRLPDLEHKEDIVDWLRKGHTRDELLTLATDTPPVSNPPVIEDREGTHNGEAERSVLAHLIRDPDLYDRVREDHFLVSAHRAVFAALQGLYEEQSRWDLVVVKDWLAARNSLANIGGSVFLDSLEPGDFEAHVGILERHAAARRLKSTAQEIDKVAADSTLDADAKRRRAEDLLLDSIGRGETNPILPISHFIDQAYQRIEEVHERNGVPTGFATGFTSLDRIMGGGIQRQHLGFIGGRTSRGKTAFALNVAHRLALNNVPTLFFELEMEGVELAQRLVSIHSAKGGLILTSDQIRTARFVDESGNPSEAMWSRLTQVIAELSDIALWIDDSPTQTVSSIWSKVERAKRQGGVDVVFVDHIGIMQAAKTDSRVQEVNKLSIDLRYMARDLDIALIVLAQLNRTADGEIPTLRHFKDSGGIEENAHWAWLLHQDDKPDSPRANVTDIIVGKNRNGTQGKVPLYNRKEAFSFFELSHE